MTIRRCSHLYRDRNYHHSSTTMATILSSPTTKSKTVYIWAPNSIWQWERVGCHGHIEFGAQIIFFNSPAMFCRAWRCRCFWDDNGACTFCGSTTSTPFLGIESNLDSYATPLIMTKEDKNSYKILIKKIQDLDQEPVQQQRQEGRQALPRSDLKNGKEGADWQLRQQASNWGSCGSPRWMHA